MSFMSPAEEDLLPGNGGIRGGPADGADGGRLLGPFGP